ncbi:MAG: hypothetical protein ABIZ64_14535 [Casimicrobium sp.]
MKNITLTADDYLIEAARARAAAERTTLNEQFRAWLKSYAAPQRNADDAMAAIDAITAQLKADGSIGTGGRKFTRDEMNERR